MRTTRSDDIRLAATPARLWVRPTWGGAGGVRELTVVALPMIFSQLSVVVNMFFDRWFLSLYDLEYHMAAAQTGGISWWLMQQLPMGIVAYLGTFVAQYNGAGRDDRVGACLWQGIYLSLAGGILNLLMMPAIGPAFAFMHPDAVLAGLETEYVRILSVGSFFLLLNFAFSFYFAGRGNTWLPMVVNFLVAGINIVLNKWFIFTPPEWLPFVSPGLPGAAWATVASLAAGSFLFAASTFTPSQERRFRVLSAWRVDPPLLTRMIRYGFPQSIHFMVDVAAFSTFLLLVGRVGPVELAATTVAFTISHFNFVPMVGMSHAVGILVGRHIGAGRPGTAEASAFAAEFVTMAVCVLFAAGYLLFPDFLIGLFMQGDHDAAVMGEIHALARVFMWFIAYYAIFDAISLIYSSALKGAGDTRFVMLLSTFAATFGFIGPCLLVLRFGGHAALMWAAAGSFVTIFAVGSIWRYRGGKWKTMKVIEPDLVAEVEAEEPGGIL